MAPSDSGDDDNRVRLRAESVSDVEVISALLQDAIIPGEDMTYDRAGRRFVMVANRFCWDRRPLAGVTSETGAPIYERRLCGVRIEGVNAVEAARMPVTRRGALFNLLAITVADAADARVEILFSDGVSLRLAVDGISILAEDLDDGWPTSVMPAHDRA
ncbi:MAG: DUF2948 family protein [Pseudomonadota bacterium]|nr:DUF2948 family protein [Pseudomonadota bacterium]